MSPRSMALAFVVSAACGNVEAPNNTTIDAPVPDRATCTDGLRNGTETDIDCGGSACDPCVESKGCAGTADCISEVCTNDVCQAPACSDGVKNGNEIDVDCGGSCGAGSCKTGQKCSASADCVSTDCDAGVCVAPKHVFVTNARFRGAEIGGLDGADMKCQGAATTAGLSGSYKAWLSDETGSPSTRFARSTRPYIRVDGIVVAMSYADLVDGTLMAAISKTETNATGSSDPGSCNTVSVFTNTRADGTLASAATSCSNWTSSSGGADMGRLNDNNSSWTAACFPGDPVTSTLCNAPAPIYCFEQ